MKTSDLRKIFQLIPECIIVLDAWEYIVDFNQNVIGVFPEIKKGKKIDEFICLKAEIQDITLSDGRVFSQRLSPIIENNSETGKIIWLTDVTQLKNFINETNAQNDLMIAANKEMEKANDEIVSLGVQRATLAKVQSRLHLAHELHDTVGHLMTVLNTLYRSCLIKLESDMANATKYMKQSIDLCKSAVKIVSDAFYTSYEGAGAASFSDTLRQLIPDNGPFAIHLNVEGEEDYTHAPLTMSALRICQEAITNSMRHSGAKNIYINVLMKPCMIEILINDDGSAGKITEGFGMKGMRQRAKAHNGNVRFTKNKEGGLVISASLYNSNLKKNNIV